MANLGPNPPLSLDNYAEADFKNVLGTTQVNGVDWLAPTWVGDQRRRIQMYNMLFAYLRNRSNAFLEWQNAQQQVGVKERREYGDASNLVEQLRSSVMGDQQTISVEDADRYDPEAEKAAKRQKQLDEEQAKWEEENPDLAAQADNPPFVGIGAPKAPKAADTTNKPGAGTGRVANQTSKDPSEEDDGSGFVTRDSIEQPKDQASAKLPPEDDTTEYKPQAERQDMLREWAEDERFLTKMIENERNAAGLGDSVWVEGWDSERERPRLLTYDPACYFPVLDGSTPAGEYPRKVHLAWQLTNDDVRRKYPQFDYKEVVHCITYEMRDEPITVPWEKKQQKRRCYMTEAEYVLTKQARSADDLTQGTAIYMTDDLGEIKDRDLGIDFLPVVHIPNTVAEDFHFGRSVLANVLQIIDDIQAVDSDLAKSASLVGSPMVHVAGATPKGGTDPKVGPGEFLLTGPDGKVTLLSAAEGIAALRELADYLRALLSTNSRVAEAVLGRIDPSKVASGVLLALSFAPMKSLVDEMRLVRKDKYRMILKFAQRFFMANGKIKGEIYKADIIFGSFLPSDVAETVTTTVAAYTAKIISRQTAVKRLQGVGFPIEDVAEELALIEREDFEAANALLDATSNHDAVTERLGVKAKEPPPSIFTMPGAEGLAPQPAKKGPLPKDE